MAEQTWSFFPHFVMRQAGFPSDWLMHLDAEQTRPLLEDVARLMVERDCLRTELLREAFPAAVRKEHQSGSRSGLRHLSRLRSRVGKGTFAPTHLAAAEAVADRIHLVPPLARWVACCQELNARVAEGKQLLAADLQQVRTELRRLTASPLIQEALYLSNPDFYLGSVADYLRAPADSTRTGRVKSLERRLMAYMQRFCAKNDTASFFGPMNTGQVDPALVEPIRLQQTGEPWQKREIFVSYWGVAALAGAIQSDPCVAMHLAPRLHPLVCRDQERVRWDSIGKAASLSPDQALILSAVDGSATIRHIAERVAIDPARALTIIDSLVRARVLICQLQIPSTIFHPLTWLMEYVTALPEQWERKGYWLGVLDRLESLRRAFVTASLAERIQLQAAMESTFTAATGLQARRSPGEMYADRTLLYEECQGNLGEFRLSRAFADDLLERLKPALTLCAAYGAVLRRFYQAVGKRVFTTLSPAGAPVPYLRFIRAVQQLPAEELASLQEPVDAFRSALQELVAARSDGRVARISRADIEPLLRMAGELPAEWHTSPDLMLAARSMEALAAGDYLPVVGEIHQFIYVWGSQLYFYDRWPEAETNLRSLLQDSTAFTHIATVLNERKHKGLIHESFPGTMIEVSAPAAGENRKRVSIARLQVELDGAELILRNSTTGERLDIYTGGDEQLHLWIFALPRVGAVPISCGAHTPRVEVEGVVYQRERWDLPARELLPDPGGNLFDAMLSLQQAAGRLGLPPYTFIRVPDEKKPYYIDLANPLCVELLQSLLQRNDRVTVSEMLPDPGGLWLRDEQGSYCCELRTLAFCLREGK